MAGAKAGSSSPGRWVALRLPKLLWPRGEAGTKLRVAAALALVLAAKLIVVVAPWLYKMIVDRLSGPAAAAIPVGLILAYGLAHVGAQLVEALRRLVFVRVAQRAIRHTALQAF